MRLSLILLAIPASLSQLVVAQSYSTSMTTNESCLTKMSLTTAAPSPVPTTSTTAETETSTATLTVTVASAVSTENAVTTKTNYNTITIRSANATVTGGTATVTNNAQVTVGTNYMKTLIATTTVCTGELISTITVASTTTVYADATPSGSAQRKRHPNPFGVTLNLKRRQGSSPSTAAEQGTNLPVEVLCTEAPTAYILDSTTTVTSGTSTVTGTSTSTSIVNIYSTKTVYFTTTSSALTTTTITHSSIVQAVLTSTSTLETACGASTVTGTAVYTVTQASRCAAAAMTSAAGSHDIVQVDDHPMGGAAGVVDGVKDPSACCQLCLDTEDCAAAAHLPKSGSCRLEFTSPSSCGIGLYGLSGNSEDGNQGEPGTGWWVQGGCGSAEIFG